jgi:hypothetical protein
VQPGQDTPRLSRRALLGGAAALAATAAVGGWRLAADAGDPAGIPTDPPGRGAPAADALAQRLVDVPLQDSWLPPPDGGAEERAAWSYRARFPADGRESLLVVGAAGRYELRVDGRPIARGPAPFTHAEAVGDIIDLAGHLQGGAPEVEIEVVVIDPAMETPRSDRPWDDERQPLPGGHVLVVGVADGAPWTPVDGWRVAANAEWDLATPRINHVQPWVEHRLDAALGTPTAAAAGSAARTPVRSVGAASGHDGEGGRWRTVEAGDGPYPVTSAVSRQSALAPWIAGSSAQRRRPTRIVRAGTSPAARPEVEDLFPAMAAAAIERIATDDAARLLEGEAWAIGAEEHDVHLIVDLGQVWFGTPYVLVDAAPGATVDLAASEALDEADRLLVDDVGSRHAHRMAADRAWRWEPHGARYLQVAVRGGGPDVGVREVGLAVEPTPERDGAFACADEVLTEVWEAGARTLEGGWGDLLAADAGREQRAWVGDLHVALRVGRSLWWERSRVEGERFLRRVAQAARPDGSLPKHAPGEAPEASTIPSYVLSWVLALAEHEAAYGEGLAGELEPTRERALAWFDRWRRDDGIVEGVDGWHFFDWTPRRAGGVALLYTAVRAQADLVVGDRPPVTPDRAAAVFAQDVRPAWADQQGEPQTSQAANAQAVLAGLLDGEPARAALRDTLARPRYFAQAIPPDEAWEQMDLATESVGAQTYQGAFLLDALARVQLHAEALELIRERWGALAAQDPTLGELWQPTASRCHPWSAGPTSWLTAEVLGLRLLDATTVDVAPADVDIDWAEGALPTAAGPIRLRWERRDGQRSGTLHVPEGARASVDRATFGPGTHEVELG